MNQDTFTKRYAALNSEQREAVDQINGPVLVIAGPGTGKTELLSVRVANILKQTDYSPENILCLTFTNKAALNMRERLISLIGTSANGVTVKTFHSFASEVMSQHPDYFWNGAKLVTIPEITQLEIIQSIQQSLPLSSPLARKFAGEFTGTKDIQNALKLVKEAGLTPSKLKAIITANTAYIDGIEPELVEILSTSLSYRKLPDLLSRVSTLPTQAINDAIAPLISLDSVLVSSLEHAIALDEGSGKTTNTSKWKQRWLKSIEGKKGLHDERKRGNWWLELSEVYEQYRDQLHIRGYYDYADMLVEVISRLEAEPEMLSDIQEQYQYVLIDEFQDTNAAQLRLAHLVADHPIHNGRPNLMVVGDDDQSIYKFNGAELNNILNFRQFYDVKKPIVLTRNYRSSQAILDTAQRIAEQATDRIVRREPDITKELVAVNAPREPGEITHTIYDTKEHQQLAVAQHIAKKYSQDTSIVVLARSHESLREMASILLRMDVPVRYEQQNNIFDNEAVQQIILLAKTITAVSDGDEQTTNCLLSQLLPHPMWQIDATVLWKLAVQNRYNPEWLISLATHELANLNELANWLHELARLTKSVPLQVVMEYLIGLREGATFTSPIKSYFTERRELSQIYLDGLSAIHLLRNLTTEFSPNTNLTLQDFLRFVEVSQENNRIVSDSSIFVSAPHAVELLTVHKAKGLEFDSVYIIDAIDDNWKPKNRGRKAPANLPLQPYGDDYDDYVRLMYVAVTRAKSSLVISSYKYDSTGNQLLAAPLVTLAISPKYIASSPEFSIPVLEQSLTWPRLESTIEKQLLQPVLESFQLSVTALLNFLDVTRGGPEYFKQRNLLRLPEVKTTSQAYGTAIHSALEYAQVTTNTSGFNLDTTILQFEKVLINEHLLHEETKRYSLQGKQTLTRLFTALNYQLEKGAIPEQKLGDVLIGTTKLSGKLDRLDIVDKSSMRVVDYKTGKPLTSLVSKDKSKAVKAWKHRLQLIFYALLVQKTARFKQYKSIECQMVYVEAESTKDLIRSYIPDQTEIDELSMLIEAVWKKIQSADLPNTEHYTKDIDGIMQFQNDLLADNT